MTTNNINTITFHGQTIGIPEWIEKHLEKCGVKEPKDMLPFLNDGVNKHQAEVKRVAKQGDKIQKVTPTPIILEEEIMLVSAIMDVGKAHAMAECTIKNGEIIQLKLLQDSMVCKDEQRSIRKVIHIQRKTYQKNRLLVLCEAQPSLLKLTESQIFNAASTAAEFVAGYRINGLVSWKVGKKTLGQYVKTFVDIGPESERSISALTLAVEIVRENGGVWDKSIRALSDEIIRRGHKTKGKTPWATLNSCMFYSPKGKSLFEKRDGRIYLK